MEIQLLSLIGIVCGILVAIVALAVQIGWLVHSVPLVQVHPDFSPMQFNTALCFLFCAVNLIFFNTRWQWLKSFGLVGAGFAFVTVMQYVFKTSIGIDTFFIMPFTHANTAYIGRMAPNTGANFIYMGSMLFIGAHFNKYPAVRLGIIIVTSIIIALTIVPLLAYLSGIQTAYPWKNLTGMAVHTACCFLLLSIGLICQVWNHAKETPYALLIPLVVSLITASLSMSGAINAYENLKYQELMKQEAYFEATTKNISVPASAFSKEIINRKSSYISHMVLVLGLVAALLITLTGYFRIKWRQNAKALEESEERLHLAVTGTTDGLFDWDYKTGVFYFSPRLEEMLGYEHGELEPRFSVFWDLVHPDDKEKLQDEIIEQHKLKNNSNIEFQLRKKSGNYFSINFRSTPSCNMEGKVVRITGFISDISMRKEIDKIKNEFISIVSHELRTPLTSIRGSLGLVLGGSTGDISDKSMEFLEIARRNCDRLVRLINDMLDIEKIEAGKIEFKYEICSLNKLIEDAIVNNQMYADKFGIKLNFSPGQDIKINVDADRLMQVLTNLISNAVKFSKPNGEVLVAVKKQERYVRVSVIDKGIGIPEESHYKIFQKFSQVDSSSVREQEGSGLGLSISKAIIEKLGGTLHFTSSVGEGTEFYFELPCF